MDNMNYLKYGGKVEDYLVEVLRDAKNKEQIINTLSLTAYVLYTKSKVIASVWRRI